MPATVTTPMTAHSAFLRDQPAPSCTMEVQVSVSEMALVKAANSTSRKNRKPTTVAAPPISANTVGRMTNMSDGPELAATASPEPMATNAAGTIMRPARNDTPMSKPPMRATLCVRLDFLSR